MATRNEIIAHIKQIFREEMAVPVAIGDVKYQQLIDEEQGIFELKIVGWNQSKRIYGTLFHFEIRDTIIYIHHDSTEEGIATSFERIGVNKDQIVLGWIPPSQRKYTDYANA